MLSKEELNGLAVGQRLLQINTRGHSHVKGTCEVTRIGKKYFYVRYADNDGKLWGSEIRHFLEDGKHDAGQYISRYELWVDENKYNSYQEDVKAWDRLYQTIRGKYQKPPHLTAEQINEINTLISNQTH